jgi:hypothetical protein
VEDPRQPHHAADAHGQADQPAAQLLHLPLQGRGAIAGERHQLTDPPELGGDRGGRHDTEPGPGHRRGPKVGHRPALGERGVGREARVGILVHGLALAGERGLRHTEPRRLDEADVGRDLSAGLDGDQVAGDQVGRRQADETAVTPGHRFGDGEGPQPGEGPSGVPFRAEADSCVQDQGRQDRDRLRALAEDGGNGGRQE